MQESVIRRPVVNLKRLSFPSLAVERSRMCQGKATLLKAVSRRRCPWRVEEIMGK